MLFKKSILLIVSTLSFVVYSQNFFNKLDSVTLGTGWLFLHNNIIYTKGISYNPSGSGSIVLCKNRMSDGELTLVDTFSVDGIASYDGDFIEWNDRIILFNTTSNIAPYNGNTANLQLSILDTNFNITSTTIFGGNNQEISNTLIASPNAFYLLGSSNSWDNGNGDVFVRKTDSLGSLVWEFFFGTFETDYAKDIIFTEDSCLLVSGVKRISNDNWDIFFTKMDTLGNEIWTRSYGSNLGDFTGEVVLLRDNSFLICQTIYDGSNTSSGFIKIDGNGNIIWNIDISANTYTDFGFVNPIENEDGSILVSCVTKNVQDTPISRVYLLDPFGNVLWYKDYFTRDDIAQYIYDIKPSTDGGYIMAGSAFPVGVNQQHAWLIKTNCNGEDGVQYPITGAACTQYDCTLYPINANFTANKYVVDLAVTNGDVEFTNTSANTTSRVWSFGDGTMDYTDATLTHTYQTEGTYEVQLITFHGTCSDTTTQTIEVINSLGLTTIPKPTLKVYPNPSNGQFTIEFSHPTTATAQIIDATGKLVSIIDINDTKNSYQIIDLTTGIYSIVINYGDGLVESKRLIIK